ncbi:MAG: zinc dependent phospholipase C family protein [Anaerolineae bacterium]|nr:zinc dependent phospholipase C family protein [Anaerolineae bacterium]
MPTPFMHLNIAYKLLNDHDLPADAHAVISADIPAYLLGSIVADARVYPGADRELTHFYRYDRPMPDHPWREMLRQNPSLAQPETIAERAFVAGYVAHLGADEYWSKHVLGPYFANGKWGNDIHWRFFVLHLLLITLDERDEACIPVEAANLLRQPTPHNWLPFMDDRIIEDWRDYLADQLQGESETVDIFAQRVHRQPEELRQMVDNPQQMRDLFWQHISPALMAELERDMYAFSRQQLTDFVNELNS